MRLITPSVLAAVVMSSLPACQHFARSSGNRNTNWSAEDEKNAELSLLRKYRWTTKENGMGEGPFQLPRPVSAAVSWREYLTASQAIGLDFSTQEGKMLYGRGYEVKEEAAGQKVIAHFLLAENRIVGAWLTVQTDPRFIVEKDELSPGVHALNVNPHKHD